MFIHVVIISLEVDQGHFSARSLADVMVPPGSFCLTLIDLERTRTADITGESKAV